jgi:predicted deacetylase
LRKLIISIHDVTPKHRDRLERIEAFLSECGVQSRYSMLVVPDFWRAWPLREHPDFCAWLRARSESGVEILLHGYFHRDEAEHRGAIARFQASSMTAGEGEFLGLEHVEARRRLAAGKALLEDVVGRPVTGFVAPAWLYGAGTHSALRDLGFVVAENQFSVWSPLTMSVLSRAPVVSYASRSPARLRSSIAWSRAATTLLKPFASVRLALHPHDFDSPELVAEAQRAIRALAYNRDLATYDSLTKPPPE